MTSLRLATSTEAEAIHAARPGDDLCVCGRALCDVLEQSWDMALADQYCQRCRDAVVVLSEIRAVDP